MVEALHLAGTVAAHLCAVLVGVRHIVVCYLEGILQSLFLCALACLGIGLKNHFVAVALGCNNLESGVGRKLFGDSELELV